MKKHFRYLILLMLGVTIATGLVYAQTVPIGGTVQPVPFESNPQAYTDQNTEAVSPTLPYDGSLLTSAVIYLGKDPAFPGSPVSTAYFELHTFKTPVSPEFTPGWVEIKMKYETAGTNNDKYRIEYSTDGTTWVDLQPDVIGGAFSAAIRPWSQLTEPQDTSWSWSDIAGLRVRVFCTKDPGPFPSPAWDLKQMVIHEVWATVYPLPLPPASPTSVSVQPGAVMGVMPYDALFAPAGPQGYFFVELYVNDVTDMYNYEFWLEFDTAILTPVSGFNYYPWVVKTIETFDDANGWVRLSFKMEDPVPIGEGFAGSSPIYRIYFQVDAYGGGGGGGAYGGLGGTADIIFRRPYPDSFLGDTEGKEIPADYYDGWFSGPHAMSYVGSLLPDPSHPEDTMWHEIWADHCKDWKLISWEDDPDNIDGVLSESDQIVMTNASGWKFHFHVDAVTITIHWTFKEYEGGPLTDDLGAAEPYVETIPIEDGTSIPSAMGTYWHQIYPDYCRWFMISSHEDSDGDGNLDICEQFDFTYFDPPGETRWAHLDDITTDIIISQKPIEPEPPMFEFPLGIGFIMALAPLIPIVYLWRTRKKSR